MQSCSDGRDVCCRHGGCVQWSSRSLSVPTVRAGEECQGHAGKDCGPVAVFSVRSPVADVRVCERVRVRMGEAGNWLSWQPNGHTLQSHIEMTLIEQII